MKIEVVGLKLSKECTINIPGDIDEVYGVESSGKIFCETIGGRNIEEVAILCLDSTNKIINFSIVGMGNIENVHVSIAQVMKTALLSNASKIIVAHNHPSGVLEITSNDIDMTKKIGMLANYFDIELIDSLVVSEIRALSIRESLGEKNNE